MSAMNPRTRLAALCPLLLSSLALGPVAVAQAPSVVTVGSCTVKPSDDGKTVTVTGTDFIGTGGAGLHGSSGNFEGLGNLDGVTPSGSFTRTGLPPGEYHVESQKVPSVKCTIVASDKVANSKAVREARNQGFIDGVKAGGAAAKESCDSKAEPKPKKPGLAAQDQAVEDAYGQGFIAGAESAFTKFCRLNR
ncbi:hypothetical protein [Streptomyces sp. NBC_01408]|uniref:hypothetical protein n=1 Tax=Streptomyces sp. NBC_01408 TaxID=2903855 RepID=UPI0022568B51|nr:hypothetical protein [Streptomyces sp. NBC_01408]MCX4694942.1 hypothetical protein [Streptomyces sp. NBC_01408]